MLHIGLIGSGAIAMGVLELTRQDPSLQVSWVIASERSLAAARDKLTQLQLDAQVLCSLPADAKPDLLVECAGHSAIEQHVIPALERGISCLVVSVGALSSAGLAEQLEAAARRGNSHVELLPGAIGAIDALAAARVGGLETVIYSGRKPAQAWKGTPAEQVCNLDTLQEAKVIFEGSAREAARLFPKNANVAATLSLAGLGLDRTQVRLIADPHSEQNIHQVEASGAFGSFELTMRGKPLPSNPKTSALTVFSVVRALGNHAGAVAI
ncbi:aspartate dehydrogenase [Pokkaliibacter plantistimulans]|uniref:L-aspartate dehydrogenase n=1 Tax=Proteobacteria bacterium 228 TaxID=2083153 RepID=A0A2S5KR38_9PROT|nr:aspartate dehydrogenase [Pokkaliibacter plantistimulans]PPC77327.1 aspartate dehydrogenase [Pokkaliibacter plantistimulans]